MTDSNEDVTTNDNSAQKPAGDLSQPSAEIDVNGLAAEVSEAQTRLRAQLAEVREGFDELKLHLQNTASLKDTTKDLLAAFKRTSEALAAESAVIEREKAALERDKTVLLAQRREVATALHERDQGYADQRAALLREFTEQRETRLSALTSELVDVRSKRLSEVTTAENVERTRLRAEIAQERADWDATLSQQQRALRQQQDELERQRGALSALQSALDGKRVELDENELDLERRGERLMREVQRRAENLDEEVATLLAEERTSFESALLTAIEEARRLRTTVQSQTELLGGVEHLRSQLGGREPGEVIRALNTQADRIRDLTEDLATRPTEEMRSQFKSLEATNKKLQARIDELEKRLQQNEELAGRSSMLLRENVNLTASNKSLEQRAKIFEAAATAAETELNRLRAAYERPAEIEARYREIELPILKATEITQPTKQAPTSELEWLDGIAKATDSYGLRFHPRILKAFHTSLKTAEWSPLTILAGVSGTGKSELPRLYSHFGGLFFQSLAVQPNWDSQESMLGFFNSIDNRFDAQPVLRFLAQSQRAALPASERDNGYPGLADAVCLVLLDEMNLAHPELYFAEFLSKLELRRGKKGSDVPTLPVKIGAGMEPYQLPLGRNVLWAGTMNQDETTKSLSDKVLDRSIIIHFPRPTDLKRRVKLAPLDARNRGATLHKTSWQSWIVQGSQFTDEEVKPFKEFIEAMNTSLAVTGRAIAHRVWQSVEYYMANYPDVRAAGDDTTKKAQAMHVAFEDQLVQKVMPKLRGIDTRGKSKNECLDKIRGQLIAGVGGNGFNLAADFDLATELGYGQFIWQSANYIVAESIAPVPLPGDPGAAAKPAESASSAPVVEKKGHPRS
jgi:hypothetical protein